MLFQRPAPAMLFYRQQLPKNNIFDINNLITIVRSKTLFKFC